MQSHNPWALVGAFSLAAACAAQPRATAQAADVERLQCDSSSTTRDDVVRSLKVLRVDPIYTSVDSVGSTDQRVDGAKMVVRPPEGVSVEQMTRVLQCHDARMVLGHINAVANDPYWLPDTWVNIDVKPEQGNYAIILSADTVRSNLQVYGRANHFADEHMVTTDPGLP